MKKFTAFLLTAVMSVSSTFVVAAEEPDINVRVDGFLVELTAKPFIENGYTLVGMRDIFELLGAEVKWDSVSRRVTGTKGDRQVNITVGSTEAYVDRKKVELAIAPQLIYDNTMVPLRFVSESFDAVVEWDADNHVVVIDTAAEDYSAVAADRTRNTPPDEKLVTYEEALTRLFRESSALKNLTDSKVVIEKNLEDTQKAYMASNAMNLKTVELARAIKTLQNNLEFFEENVQNVKDLLEQGLRKTLTAIETAEQDIYLLQQKIVIEERELENLKLKLSLGMAKETDIKKAEQNLTQSKNSLTNADTGLNSAKLEVKALLGYDQRDNIRVVVPESPLPKKDTVDRYVGLQLAQSYAVRTKQIALTEAEYGVLTHKDFLYSEYQDLESLDDLENKVSSANRALTDAKVELEKIIRKAYNDILLQEQTYKSLAIDYEKAVDLYEQTVVNYLTGRATRSNLDSARLGILSAEIAMEKNRMTYADLLFSYEKPHLQMK